MLAGVVWAAPAEGTADERRPSTADTRIEQRNHEDGPPGGCPEGDCVEQLNHEDGPPGGCPEGDCVEQLNHEDGPPGGCPEGDCVEQLNHEDGPPGGCPEGDCVEQLAMDVGPAACPEGDCEVWFVVDDSIGSDLVTVRLKLDADVAPACSVRLTTHHSGGNYVSTVPFTALALQTPESWNSVANHATNAPLNDGTMTYELQLVYAPDC